MTAPVPCLALPLVASVLAATLLGAALPAAPAQGAEALPDLKVRRVSTTRDLAPGDQMYVARVVINRGGADAPRSRVRYLLSTDAERSADDRVLGGSDAQGLAPGARTLASAPLLLPEDVEPGTYRVVACADVGDHVRESREANNCKATRHAVTVTPGSDSSPARSPSSS